MLLLWLATTAHADECRASVNDLRRAWRDLAVPVPAGSGGGRIDQALEVVVAHGAIDADLRANRKKRLRAELAATLERASSWLAQNPAARGADVAGAALAAARPACPAGPSSSGPDAVDRGEP